MKGDEKEKKGKYGREEKDLEVRERGEENRWKG